MDERMARRKYGRTDCGTDGWEEKRPKDKDLMDRWMDRGTSEETERGPTDGWGDRWTDGWTDGRTDGRTDVERRECVDAAA